jgi:hypothetical protein
MLRESNGSDDVEDLESPDVLMEDADSAAALANLAREEDSFLSNNSHRFINGDLHDELNRSHEMDHRLVGKSPLTTSNAQKRKRTSKGTGAESSGSRNPEEVRAEGTSKVRNTYDMTAVLLRHSMVTTF